jgi:hypothetical protein
VAVLAVAYQEQLRLEVRGHQTLAIMEVPVAQLAQAAVAALGSLAAMEPLVLAATVAVGRLLLLLVLQSPMLVAEAEAELHQTALADQAAEALEALVLQALVILVVVAVAQQILALPLAVLAVAASLSFV